MKTIIEFFKNVFYLLIGSVVGCLVGSLMLMMAVGAATQLTITTLVVGALFLPFHASDIRGFYEERRWALIALR